MSDLCGELLEPAFAVFSQQVRVTSVLITEDHPLGRELFEAEEEDLFNELQALPRFALIRRFNDLIKRAKAVKVELCLSISFTSDFTFYLPRSTAPSLHI